MIFPEIEPKEKGTLKVSSLHSIYWERSGNPKGLPILIIHGGPGGGSSPGYRRYFDPERFNIFQFDSNLVKSDIMLIFGGFLFNLLSHVDAMTGLKIFRILKIHSRLSYFGPVFVSKRQNNWRNF